MSPENGAQRRRRCPQVQEATMHRVDPFDPGIAVALSSFEKKTKVFRNFEAPQLYEEAIRRGEAEIADGGALVAATGAHTGRSPHDKFIVHDELTRASIWWENSQAMTPEQAGAGGLALPTLIAGINTALTAQIATLQAENATLQTAQTAAGATLQTAQTAAGATLQTAK